MEENGWASIVIPQTGETGYYEAIKIPPFTAIEHTDGFGFGFYGVLLQDKPALEGTKVMCHHCGGWHGKLSGHIKKHDYRNVNEYKDRFSLFRSTSLESERLRQIQREIGRQRVAKGYISPYPFLWQKGNAYVGHCQAPGSTKIEGKNKRRTCPIQVEGRCLEILKANPRISARELRQRDEALLKSALVKYGTFNNMKRILGGILKPRGGQFSVTHSDIIESIQRFVKKYERNPSVIDYKQHRLICSTHAVRRRFGSTNNALINANFKPTLSSKKAVAYTQRQVNKIIGEYSDKVNTKNARIVELQELLARGK